jgi:hypothetical protein
MSTQWPVESAPLPFAHMHTPMSSWPSMQGVGGGSLDALDAVDEGPPGAGVSAEAGGASAGDGSADADASGATDAGDDDEADEGSGAAGGAG